MSNGMHVHIGTNSFVSNFHCRKFAYFLHAPENYSFIVALSQREERSLSRWGEIKGVKGASKATNFKDVDQMVRTRSAFSKGKMGRTYECRIFLGIPSFTNVIGNLEFLDALLNYTKDYGIHRLNSGDFIQWVEKQPKNKYVLFREILTNLDLEKVVQDALFLEIFETVRNCLLLDRPRVVMDALPRESWQKFLTYYNKAIKARELFVKNNTICVKTIGIDP